MKYNHMIKHDGTFYPAGTSVPVELHIKGVEPTNEVPESALNNNSDESVNAYDENGNPIGTVGEDKAKKLEEQAAEILEDGKKLPSKKAQKNKIGGA